MTSCFQTCLAKTAHRYVHGRCVKSAAFPRLSFHIFLLQKRFPFQKRPDVVFINTSYHISPVCAVPFILSPQKTPASKRMRRRWVIHLFISGSYPDVSRAYPASIRWCPFTATPGNSSLPVVICARARKYAILKNTLIDAAAFRLFRSSKPSTMVTAAPRSSRDDRPAVFMVPFQGFPRRLGGQNDKRHTCGRPSIRHRLCFR